MIVPMLFVDRLTHFNSSSTFIFTVVWISIMNIVMTKLVDSIPADALK